MANSDKGEVGLTLGGKDYRFKLGTSALIQLQEEFSTADKIASLDDILNEVNKGRLKYVRAFLWAGLQRFHPGTTLEDVSEILDEADESEVVKLLRALGLTTQPDPKDVAELSKGVKSNPQMARARKRGTGGNSSSRPDASA
jgi:hypothetical protein